MTLLRQIMLVVVMIFVLLFGANFILTVISSGNYLEEQMTAHAEDTATSLGLSMTRAISEDDQAGLELLASAVFDRGYYREIHLIDLDDRKLVDLKNPLSIEGVPDWFTSLIPLPAPSGTTEIMDGWVRLGKLTVTTHPGYAYRDLWRLTVDFFYLFSGILVFSYLILAVVLQIVLRPLQQVEQQADDICERQFAIVDKIPATRELRRVVQAMNRMSGKLQESFERQLQLTESLREEASTDPLTGLANRREFDALVTSMLSSESGAGASVLMIMQIRDFAGINNQLGRLEADQLLKQIAGRLAGSLKNQPEAIISRRSGSEFAVFIPHTEIDNAQQQLQTCFAEIASIELFTSETYRDGVHMGGSFHYAAQTLSVMLTAADTALRRAQTEAGAAIHFLVHDENEAGGLVRQAGEWKAILDAKIASGEVLFHYQPTFTLSDRAIIGNEVFVRLRLDDDVINAGVFMPMAERFGLLVELDKMIIEQALSELQHNPATFFLNLSSRSLQDLDFEAWLLDTFSRHVRVADRVVIEFHEVAMQLAGETVRRLVEFLSPRGFRFSVDHFGTGGAAFSYLRSLDVNYIKIDRSFITGISTNSDNQFFIQSLVQIAQTREMMTIAEGVEAEADLAKLAELGVDAAMGYLLGRPGPDSLT